MVRLGFNHIQPKILSGPRELSSFHGFSEKSYCPFAMSVGLGKLSFATLRISTKFVKNTSVLLSLKLWEIRQKISNRLTGY